MVPVWFLKHCCKHTLKPLIQLINLSFHSKTFPYSLKITNIISITKKGNSLFAQNYRPNFTPTGMQQNLWGSFSHTYHKLFVKTPYTRTIHKPVHIPKCKVNNRRSGDFFVTCWLDSRMNWKSKGYTSYISWLDKSFWLCWFINSSITEYEKCLFGGSERIFIVAKYLILCAIGRAVAWLRSPSRLNTLSSLLLFLLVVRQWR